MNDELEPSMLDAAGAQSTTGADLLRTFGAAWTHAPWGVVAVSAQGLICAINPAFEKCTGITSAEMLGHVEDMLERKLDATLFDHRRVEVNHSGVLAVHYVSNASSQDSLALKLSRVAETLREPLASVYGLAELMQHKNYDEATRRELSATVLEQLESISHIINTHLDQASVMP
ncbi:MAG: hypothetical protein ACR2I0_15340 [Rhodoferax sp.]